MFECMKRAHIDNGLTLDVLKVHWSILGHLCYSYMYVERAQSILLLPNTATISVSSLHLQQPRSQQDLLCYSLIARSRER